MQKYWVALSSIEEIDSKFILSLYDYFGDIASAYNANDLSGIEGLSISRAEKFLRLRDKTDADRLFQQVEDRGLDIITYQDARYPEMLKNISNPPAVLYCKGDISSCNLNRTLAIVGSRRASTYAKDVVKKIVSGFIDTDICIVSGLASGVDTAAHCAALDNNLKTIGVIASGLDFVYPTANKELYTRIENGNGAVISEYYPTFEAMSFRFPQRNRIVTGLSYGTLVAEASLKSGALISANLTLEQGRELMCIPGLVTNPNTQGIYKLLKDGATLVTCYQDVLDALSWQIEGRQQSLFCDNNQDLSDDEILILDAIEIEEKSIDEIQFCTKLPIDKLLINLTSMELKGIIKQSDGNRYRKL